MTRLRIYSAGTGRLQFDSSGSAADVTEESIKRDFKSDLLLYYDPARNGLRCYVKLVRSGSEQFLADYEFDPDTASPLESFKSTLEREIGDVGWRVEDDAGYEQRLYESIGSATETSPDVPIEDLEYLLDSEGQIRIGTPDESSAIGVVSYLRRAFDDRLDVAVTYSGETGTHGDVAVVVVPGATDRVTVTADQRAVLARRRLGELQEAVPTAGVGGGASAMRRALADAGAEDRLGLAIDAEDASLPGAAAGQRNAVLATLVLVPLALLAVVVRAGRETLLPALTRVQGFYVPFAGPADGLLPIAVPQYLFDFTSWHVLAVSTLVIGVALVNLPPVRRTLTALTGVSIPGLGAGGDAGGPTPSDRASAAIDELAALQRVGGGSRIDGLLGEFGLETGSQSTRARTALAVQAAGVLAGVLAAAATFVVASLGASVVFDLLTDSWTLVLDAFLLGGVLAAVGTVGAAAAILLGGIVGGGGRSRSRSGSRPRSSTGSGVAGPAARHGGRFDLGAFERRVSTEPHRAAEDASAALDELRTHGHGSPTPRSTRIANAVLDLSRNVSDGRFSLSPSDRALVEEHADRNSGGGMMEELANRPSTDRTGSTDRAGGDRSRPATDETSRARGGGDRDTETSERRDSVEPGGGSGGDADGDSDSDDLLWPADGATDSAEGEGTGDETVDRLDVDGTDEDRGDADPFETRRTTEAASERSTGVAGADTGSTDDGPGESTGPTESAGSERSSVTGGLSDLDGSFDAGSDLDAPLGIEQNAGTDDSGEGRFPQFRYDAANTGCVAPVERTLRTPASAWDPVPLGEECTTTPVAWRDYLLVGTRVGRVHAISLSTGDRFVVATPGVDSNVELAASPAVVDDHVVVVTTTGEIVGYRVAVDGDRLHAREAWRSTQPVASGEKATASPTVADGRLFVAGGDGRVHALGADGDAVWDDPYDTGAGITLSSPAVAGGTVYVATVAGTLHAIDADTGEGRWIERLGDGQIFASPAVADSRLVVGSHDGTLYTVDTAERTVVRKERVGDAILPSAALCDGTAYVASDVAGADDRSAVGDGQAASADAEATSDRAVVTAFDLDGRVEPLWRTALDATTVSSPTVAGEGLYLGTNGGRLVGLDRRSGDPLWQGSVDVGHPIESSVAAVDGGLYVPDSEGTVWGFVDAHD
ncbi:PQQ-binding-like beta-propeller repeat protein [Salinigranum sp. GCM10025319]|uniref:outer membrane protein assembly factor BamB family protein n=1 Tax=Salinigranum sp. GCM10025319 TaxID=3252687 RepID=UPI00361AA4A3